MIPSGTNLSGDTRERLLHAARQAFMKEGYRASMDGIAALAGVAKQTLYNHFAGKDELFAETASLTSNAISVTLDGQTGDVRGCLLRFARAFRSKVLGEDSLAVFRALVAETPRMPRLARAFFDKGAEKTATRLAEFLGRAMADGRLRRDDPRFAAEMLLSMLGGFEHFRRVCGAHAPAANETMRVERIVDCFLRAWAPDRGKRT